MTSRRERKEMQLMMHLLCFSESACMNLHQFQLCCSSEASSPNDLDKLSWSGFILVRIVVIQQCYTLKSGTISKQLFDRLFNYLQSLIYLIINYQGVSRDKKNVIIHKPVKVSDGLFQLFPKYWKHQHNICSYKDIKGVCTHLSLSFIHSFPITITYKYK